MIMSTISKQKSLWALASIMALFVVEAPSAQAQVPFDPTTAVRPPPNIMLLMDATRTTLINGETCRGLCHSRGSNACQTNHEHSCSIYQNGETRLQLARRVLTGGWGWNSNGRVANSDARVSTAGIMDTYRAYRWGVSWYDGTGVRLALDPTSNNDLAQKTVIDFGLPCFEYDPRDRNRTCYYGLNSWMPNIGSTGASGAGGRQSRALQYLDQYWRPGVSPPQAPPVTRCSQRYGSNTCTIPGGIVPNDSVVIDQDDTNVLINAPDGTANGGCRRNFTIMLMDGHGGGSYGGIGNGPAAGAIFNIPSIDGGGNAVDLSTVQIPIAGGGFEEHNFANQVFAIHFGVQDKPNADRVADWGYDGKPGGDPTGILTAFSGAPGGRISDLSSLKAAFTQVMELLLSGDYAGSTPSISRFGEHVVYTRFSIPDCGGVPAGLCNFGRPGDLIWLKLNTEGNETALPGQTGADPETVSVGTVLEVMDHEQRRLLTAFPEGVSGSGQSSPTELNCGTFANVTGGRCAGNSNTLTTLQIPTPGSQNIAPPSFGNAVTTASPGDFAYFGRLGLKYNDLAYLAGDPVSRLQGGPFRGDWFCDATNPSTCCLDLNNDYLPDGTSSSNARGAACLDRHFKMADIANSRPVIVGAPTGVAEDLARWKYFLEMNIRRSTGSAGIPGSSNDHYVKSRDRVVYVGGNDGFLHAFLVGEDTGPDAVNRVSVKYGKIPNDCGTDTDRTRCHGRELWAYSPGLVQESWNLLKAGHFYMIDGTPTVSDVLFTKGITNPPKDAPCSRHEGASCNDWEYRTVLMQCLGIGGPGCFAMDVTNPYNPQLLWEREFTKFNSSSSLGAPTARVTTTSRPQIHRVKRVVNGVTIPYYVAIMGGGMQEAVSMGTNSGNRTGTILVVGIEDGFYTHSPSANLADADFAGTPTCFDSDGDSFVDTCYILTTESDIYKVRFTNSDPFQGISMSKFFDGRLAISQVYSDQASPIMAYTKLVGTFNQKGQLNLFFATGNFENMQDPAEQNYLFKVLDPEPTLFDVADVTPTKNEDRMREACKDDLGTNSPFVDESFRNGRGVLKFPSGEKVIFDPVLANRSLLFTAYKPDSNACGVGQSFLTGIYYDDCTEGLDLVDNTTPGTPVRDSFRLRLVDANGESGRATGVAVSPDQGTTFTLLDNPNSTASGQLASPGTKKKTEEKREIPLLKLWWRQIMP
jgi:hypothetical protein